MRRLLIVLLLLFCWHPTDAAETAVETSTPTPITSAIQLHNYLEHGGASPLDLLSRPARQRFLDSIRFGTNGIRGFSAAELEAELTQDEAREVLSLFGLQAYTPPLARMRARHFNIGATETTDADTRFDAVMRAARTASPTRNVVTVYEHGFRSRQTATGLRVLSDGDLALTFRAATSVASFDPAPAYANDMRRDLAELERRHLAAPIAYEDVYRSLIRSRDFTAADEFHARHPGAHLPPLPKFRDIVKHPGQTVLQLNADGTELVRRAVSLDEPVQVIVIAGCHFAQDAARDIESDPRLRAAFARHVLWLTPQDGNPADPDLLRWNREHPLTAIRSVYRETEWPQIDSWVMPTFYFFKDGKLDKKIVSWQREAVRTELHAVGLMP